MFALDLQVSIFIHCSLEVVAVKEMHREDAQIIDHEQLKVIADTCSCLRPLT